MFLKNSRYYNQHTVDVPLKNRCVVKAVTLRRLPPTEGEVITTKGNDQLDIMAFRQFGDATMFWHIADANSELEAGKLLKKPGRTILQPEQ